MKEVYSGIFLIEEKRRFMPSDNIYIIAGSDGVIFDAGYGNRRSVRTVVRQFKKIEHEYNNENQNFKIKRILVSHAHSDHFSGLNKLSEKLGLKVILTKRIAGIIKDKTNFEKRYKENDHEDFLRISRRFTRGIKLYLRNLGEKTFYKWIFGLSYLNKPYEIIEENSDIWINNEKWKIFHSPGHSTDHISLYSEEKGILFSGDNVLKMRSTWLGPPESNLKDYLETIRYMQNLPKLKLILPAHGDIIENTTETLTAILERMKEREEQVLHVIYKNLFKGVSPKDITKIIYSKHNIIKQIIARDWVVLTLKMLENNKKIRRKTLKKKILFFPYEDQTKLE
ncbi:MAG: MBL fold metallo-hydrolase [Promethearchaeota archaeon]